MIKLAVCDDEENVRLWLRALVEKQNAECEITEYADGASYLADGVEYDLLLLDIELRCSAFDGTGIEDASGLPVRTGAEGLRLARRIRDMELKKQPVIIFVTGHEKYVYEAFDVGAFHYLVKPVDPQRFAEVFSRAVEWIQAEEKQRRKNLVIQYAGARKTVPIDNIYYMESQNHKIVLHTKDGELEYYGKLGALEKELQGRFFRIHKSYLINFSYVDEYGRTDVTLTNGRKLLISKYKFEGFVKAYLRWMQ